MYDNNINEIHKFPSFVFGEINSHQTWGVQMGTLRGYSVHKPRNISRDYSPTHCWLKCPFQGKQAAPPLQPLKRWKTQTLGALETTLDNIRNRDHSVHIYIYIFIHQHVHTEGSEPKILRPTDGLVIGRTCNCCNARFASASWHWWQRCLCSRPVTLR